MKRVISVALALVMLTGVVAACGSKSSADSGSVVIGGIGPLTGDYATYGVSVKQGAQIAVDEINAAGGANGLDLSLEFEDDQADSEKAVSAYGTLMDAGMQVSLGAVTSGACIAVADEAQKDGILMITPSASQKEATQYDNGFRVCFTDPMQGTYSADYISENKVGSKVAIIYDKSNDYSAGITDAFVAEAKKVGLEIVAQEAFTDQSNTDFSVQLKKAQDSGADLIYIPIYAQEAAYILTQADKAGMTIPFFGCDGLDGIIEKLGAENEALAEGLMLLTPFAADATDDVTKNFVEAYTKEYKATPDQFAADGYDAVYAVKAAIEEAGIKDSSDKDFNTKIIEAMTKITVEGTTGTMTWTADGEPTKTAKAVKVVDGAYKIME